LKKINNLKLNYQIEKKATFKKENVQKIIKKIKNSKKSNNKKNF